MTFLPYNILLVEDNEGDILLTRELMDEFEIKNELHIARDGAEALEFIQKLGKFSDAITPHLILLDINLPKKSGFEVLYHLKTSEKYKHIPVIILTTSSAPDDVMKAYQNYANSFITKPVEVGAFKNIMLSVENYWFTSAELPENGTIN